MSKKRKKNVVIVLATVAVVAACAYPPWMDQLVMEPVQAECDLNDAMSNSCEVDTSLCYAPIWAPPKSHLSGLGHCVINSTKLLLELFVITACGLLALFVAVSLPDVTDKKTDTSYS